MNFSDRTKGLICAAIAGISWSILAIVLKVALQTASSGTIVWFRFVVALTTLILILFFYDRSQFRIFKRWPLLSVIAGLSLSVNFFGYQKGIELTSPSNAQVLIQAAPLTLAACGILFFGERLRPIQVLGFALSITGLGLFFNDQLSGVLENRSEFILGNMWMGIAVVTWAGFAVLQKVLTAQGWRPQEINLVLYAIAFVVLFPFAELSEFANVQGWDWVIFTYLGLNTLIAYGAMGVALKLAPASQVSIIITCNPLLTLLLMHVLEKMNVTWIQPDTVTWIGYVGALCVVAGVILAVSQPPPRTTKLTPS